MSEERNSFIFYRSFYEALQDLNSKERLQIYDAICELALNGKDLKLTGLSKTIFTLVKPQVISNTKKYMNGSKGGRPKKITTGYEKDKTTGYENSKTNGYTKEETETKANVNDNDNVNENVECRMNNDNVKDPICLISARDELLPEEVALLEERNWLDKVNLFDLLEEVFGRTISQTESERLSIWQSEYTKEYVYNAIREADLYKKHSFDYIDRILSTWKSEGKIFEEDKYE